MREGGRAHVDENALFAMVEQLRQNTETAVAEVARRAGASRTFVYDSPEARAVVSAALVKPVSAAPNCSPARMMSARRPGGNER
ncbi:hypothetical protein ACFYTU_06850 [Nonomuraea angiospora]|uniref:hypothetical protein n=1 Tax=Nonomuraea angiospora TaxID=46172 RepID=UPI0036AD54D8